MKWRLIKRAGVWTVMLPQKAGGLLGYGFPKWQDAADFLVEETT